MKKALAAGLVLAGLMVTGTAFAAPYRPGKFVPKILSEEARLQAQKPATPPEKFDRKPPQMSQDKRPPMPHDDRHERVSRDKRPPLPPDDRHPRVSRDKRPPEFDRNRKQH